MVIKHAEETKRWTVACKFHVAEPNVSRWRKQKNNYYREQIQTE
jgi:hypothetical protein